MRTFIMALMGLFFATSAIAQQRPEIFVLIEQETEHHRQCGISNEGLGAAVSSTVRRNGYQTSRAYSHIGMQAYLAVNVLRLNLGCIAEVSLKFQFSDFAGIIHSPWGPRYSNLRGVICHQSTLFSGQPATLQGRLRSDIIEMTEICINQEERNRR